MKEISRFGEFIFDVCFYAIIVLFVVITVLVGYCCIMLFYPMVEIEKYATLVMAIVAIFAFIVAWMEYKSKKESVQAQVFSEYNKRYSEDPNIVKVVKYLNYIDENGRTNNPHREKPSNYEVEMFMRFFEELEVQICSLRIDENTVLDLFTYYAKKIDTNEELRILLGVSDYDNNWDRFKKLMKRTKK